MDLRFGFDFDFDFQFEFEFDFNSSAGRLHLRLPKMGSQMSPLALGFRLGLALASLAAASAAEDPMAPLAAEQVDVASPTVIVIVVF